MGYTPDLVAGVWVGNADNTPMKGTSGAGGAAPIWHNFMERALADQPAREFPRPDGIETFEICGRFGIGTSGRLPARPAPPGNLCRGPGPLGPEYDFHQFVRIDASTNMRATEYCPPEVVEEQYYFVLPGEEGQRWAQQQGIPQPPTEFLYGAHWAVAGRAVRAFARRHSGRRGLYSGRTTQPVLATT